MKNMAKPLFYKFVRRPLGKDEDAVKSAEQAGNYRGGAKAPPPTHPFHAKTAKILKKSS
jgi:hypothetical protein